MGTVRWWWQDGTGWHIGKAGSVAMDPHTHRTRKAAESCGRAAARRGEIGPNFEVVTNAGQLFAEAADD